MKKFSLNNCGKVLLILLCIVTVVSVALVLIKGNGSRRIFLFEQQNKENLTAEIRYLKKTAAKDDIKNYVDELLLGPITPQCRPLFPYGTHVKSLFLRDGVLYVNLSEEAHRRVSPTIHYKSRQMVPPTMAQSLGLHFH